MRYMLMMHAPRSDGGYEYTEWKPEDWRRHLDYWRVLNESLVAAGELVTVQALTPPAAARVVRSTRGAPVVTDGPFAEAKEFLAGYWIVDVGDEARAFEIAAQASAAPGPGGTPLDMPIEVREVMQTSMPGAPRE